MVFSGLAYSSVLNSTYEYFQLLDNWSQHYISDIKPTTQQSCPLNYSPLIDYDWSGTQNGCDCRDISIFASNHVSRNFQTGHCDYNQTLAGCKSINPISETHMNIWKAYKRLCVLRENQNFANNSYKNKWDGSCAMNYKTCGDSIDKNLKFCVLNNSPCPIISINIGKISPGQNFNESIIIEDDLKLFWSREPGKKLPISEFRISEGPYVCLNNKLQGITKGRNDYILMNIKRSVCDKFDERFEKIDSISERDFFSYNGMSYLEKVLPSFELRNDVQYSLFARNYIPFALNCRNLISDLYDFQEQGNSITRFQTSLFICTMIFMIILIIINIIYGISQYEKPYIAYLTLMIVGICNYVGRIIILGLVIGAISKARILANFFENFDGLNCSDDETNKYLSDAGDNIRNKVVPYNNGILYLTILIICLDVIEGGVSFYYYFSKQNKRLGGDDEKILEIK